MIIRISQEGQYRLADGHRDRLDALDDRVVAAVKAGADGPYRAALNTLLAFVREHGERLDEDELTGSDVILPPPDLSLDEAAAKLDPDGLIPG